MKTRPKEKFEVHVLVERRAPHEWKRWPKKYRQHSSAAITKKMRELGPKARIVAQRSRCDLRADLSGIPWQLYREITVAFRR